MERIGIAVDDRRYSRVWVRMGGVHFVQSVVKYSTALRSTVWVSVGTIAVARMVKVDDVRGEDWRSII